MSTDLEGLLVLVILLPGFLSSVIFRALQEPKEVPGFIHFMEALAFSFGILAVIGLLRMPAPLELLRDSEGILHVRPVWPSIASSLVAAVVFPSLLSVLIEHDRLMWPFRRLGITRRTGRPSTWLDAFADHAEHYLLVQFKDGARALGWPYLYSDTPGEGIVVLQEPVWVTDQDEYVPMGADGFVIINRGEVMSMAFVSADQKPGGQADERQGLELEGA